MKTGNIVLQSGYLRLPPRLELPFAPVCDIARRMEIKLSAETHAVYANIFMEGKYDDEL